MADKISSLILGQNLTGLAFISFIGGLFGKAAEYLVYIALARGLGAEAVGVFSFGFVIMSFSMTISRLGLDKAARKFVPKYTDNQPKLTGTVIICVGISTVVGTFVSLGLFAGRDLLAQYIGESFGSTTVIFLIGIPLMAAMTVGRAASTGFLETKYSVYIKDIGQSGTAVLLVSIAAFHIGTTTSAAFGYVSSIGIGSILSIYFLYQQGGLKGLKAPQFPIKEVLVYSIPLTIAASAQYMISWTDILMLGLFVESKEIGIYQVAYQNALVLGFLSTAIKSIFPSIAANLWESDDLQRLQSLYSALTKWLLYTSTFIIIYYIFLGNDLLSLFGSDFTGGFLPLLILSSAIAFSSVVGPAGMLLIMTEYENVEMMNTSIAAIINISLNFYLIQELGILGAALATSISIVTLNFFRLAQVGYLFNVYPSVRNYWKGGLAIIFSTVMMVVGSKLPFSSIFSLLLVGVLSFGVFGLVLYLLGPDPNDSELIRSFNN